MSQPCVSVCCVLNSITSSNLSSSPRGLWDASAPGVVMAPGAHCSGIEVCGYTVCVGACVCLSACVRACTSMCVHLCD